MSRAAKLARLFVMSSLTVAPALAAPSRTAANPVPRMAFI